MVQDVKDNGVKCFPVTACTDAVALMHYNASQNSAGRRSADAVGIFIAFNR